MLFRSEQGNTVTPVPTFSLLLDGVTQLSTDAQGSAKFTNVSVGQHTISEVAPPAPWTLQSMTPSNGTVTVAAGTTCATVSAVNRRVSTADLTIQKSGPTSVVRGSSMSYTLTAALSGNTNVTGVKVIDVYPRSILTYSSATGATCSDTGTQIECTLGTMTPNQSVTITLNFSVQSATASCTNSTMTNTASITESDPKIGRAHV